MQSSPPSYSPVTHISPVQQQPTPIKMEGDIYRGHYASSATPPTQIQQTQKAKPSVVIEEGLQFLSFFLF